MYDIIDKTKKSNIETWLNRHCGNKRWNQAVNNCHRLTKRILDKYSLEGNGNLTGIIISEKLLRLFDPETIWKPRTQLTTNEKDQLLVDLNGITDDNVGFEFSSDADSEISNLKENDNTIGNSSSYFKDNENSITTSVVPLIKNKKFGGSNAVLLPFNNINRKTGIS